MTDCEFHRNGLPYNRFRPGSGSGAGWASEAVVVPVESVGQHTAVRKGRSSLNRVLRGGPGECRFG